MDTSSCVDHTIQTYIVASLICVGAVCGYIPQLVSLVKAKSTKGLSELSVFLLCISLSTLTLNILILNWSKWGCFQVCPSPGICVLNLLNVFQVGFSCLMATVVYILFIRFKCHRVSEKHISNEISEEFYESIQINPDLSIIPQWFTDWIMFTLYGLFVIVVFLLSAYEKTSNNDNFFTVFAYVLGIISSMASFVVWIPQIITLIRTREDEGLSLLMFLFQAPGSLIVVIFQSVVYKQSIITWLPYAINAVEQFIVAILLIWIALLRKSHGSNTSLHNVID